MGKYVQGGDDIKIECNTKVNDDTMAYVNDDTMAYVNGEEYCESENMLRNEHKCKASSCCHWNTHEEGEASFNGQGRCWSSIGRDVCYDTPAPSNPTPEPTSTPTENPTPEPNS